MINSINYHIAVSILSFLNERLEYYEWIQLISALVNEFGENLALRLLLQYQMEEECGEFAYKVKHAMKGTTFGSLVYIGKSHGWSPYRAGFQKFAIPYIEKKKNDTDFSFDDVQIFCGIREFRRFNLTINKNVINKTSDYKKLNNGFKPITLNAFELIKSIKKGYTFCCSKLRKVDGIISRKSVNWKSSSLIAIDIDEGMTIEEALAMKTTQDALFLYTTCSHKPDHNRFRIVFDLPYTESNPKRYKATIKSFINEYGADKACSDICRAFFGNTEAQVIVPWSLEWD